MSLIEPAKIKEKPLERDAFSGNLILALAFCNGCEIRRRYNKNAYAPFRLIIRIGDREFRCSGIEIINPVSINSSYENGSCKMIHGRTENCAKMIDIVKIDVKTKINGVFYEV